MSGTHWHAAGALEGIPLGTPVGRKLGGHAVVLVRTTAGVMAYRDACPHYGAPLSEVGRVSGDELLCTVHYWAFRLPEGCQTHVPSICLERFAVRVTTAGVEVELPDSD